MPQKNSSYSLSVEADLAFDREHIWHPYTSMHEPLPVYPVVSAKGVELHLADGRTLIDGMSSWWSAIHGYNHPELNQAATDQIGQMSHVMFGGITHKPAVNLARKLLALTPQNLQHVFFCDSGSVSIEVAIKMAIQYWVAKDRPLKYRLLTVCGGYHGDTFAAMSVCDPEGGMRELFKKVFPAHLFAARPKTRFDEPWVTDDLNEMELLLEAHADELAAVILEPIVQGAGGMWFYHSAYLKGLKQLCEQYDVLLILDEIATGFGRTGRMFAFEHAGITPDILCLGKALTGGYMSLAATLTTSELAGCISSDKKTAGIFMHGPTFMANPLACAIGCASLDLLQSSPWESWVKNIAIRVKQALEPLVRVSGVADVRVLGAIGVVEMQRPVDVAAAQKYFVDNGVWIRPFAKLIYIMPPYVISEDDLGRLTDVMKAFVESC